jgi:glycosyltransferase involved in cell wall biosynthesis
MLDHIVTPTRFLKQCLVAINPRLERRISVVPFGVDPNEFCPAPRDAALLAEWELDPAAPIVTVLARFQSVKGHAMFLDAALPILEAFPSTRFLFVGENEFDTPDANETRDRIRARVRADSRLHTAVVFCGFRRDIPRILNLSDVLVCPSAFESYGMANLEAMACGVPVVSTNVGGPSETVLDGETGFLVAPDAPQACAARVIELLSRPELRQCLGQCGRRWVEQHFTLQSSSARLADLYRSLVGRAA